MKFFIPLIIFVCVQSSMYSQDTTAVRGGYNTCIKSYVSYALQKRGEGINSLNKALFYNTSGRIDSICIYEIQSGSSPVLFNEYFRYNENGKLQEWIQLDRVTSAISKKIFKYDSLGLPVEEQYYHGDKKDTVFVLTSDNNRRLIKKAGHTNGKLIYESTFTYNDAGQNTGIFTVSPLENDSFRNEETTLFYNSRGFLIQKDMTRNKILVSREIFENNSSGQPLKKSCYSSDLKLVNKEVYFWDKYSNQAFIREYNDTGKMLSKTENYYTNWTDMDVFVELHINGDSATIPDNSVFRLCFPGYCMNYPIINQSFIIGSKDDLFTNEAQLVIGDLVIDLCLVYSIFSEELRNDYGETSLHINFYNDFENAVHDFGDYVDFKNKDSFKSFTLWNEKYSGLSYSCPHFK